VEWSYERYREVAYLWRCLASHNSSELDAFRVFASERTSSHEIAQTALPHWDLWTKRRSRDARLDFVEIDRFEHRDR
jgi:hypothetical protein